MMYRKTITTAALTAAVILAAGACVYAATNSGLSVFLPGNGALSDLTVVPAAERDAVDEKGLYDMYDGAVPDMQKRGICYAHQRMYKNARSKSVTIDVYTLYTWQHAKAYYGAEKASIKSLAKFTTWPLKAEACAAQASGTTTCFMWARNYAVAITVQGASAADMGTAKSIATFISNKIKSYYSG